MREKTIIERDKRVSVAALLFTFSSKTSGVFAIVLLDYSGSSDPK